MSEPKIVPRPVCWLTRDSNSDGGLESIDVWDAPPVRYVADILGDAHAFWLDSGDGIERRLAHLTPEEARLRGFRTIPDDDRQCIRYD